MSAHNEIGDEAAYCAWANLKSSITSKLRVVGRPWPRLINSGRGRRRKRRSTGMAKKLLTIFGNGGPAINGPKEAETILQQPKSLQKAPITAESSPIPQSIVRGNTKARLYRPSWTDVRKGIIKLADALLVIRLLVRTWMLWAEF
jgi:hypothetical protein